MSHPSRDAWIEILFQLDQVALICYSFFRKAIYHFWAHGELDPGDSQMMDSFFFIPY